MDVFELFSYTIFSRPNNCMVVDR